MNTLLQDLRYGLRMLAKSPGFAAIAILTLALGIGANTAIFSLTDQVLLRQLPVEHPEQLVVLRSTGARSGRVWADYDSDASFSYPMYKDLRDRNKVFSGLLTCFPVDVNVSGHGRTERAAGELVSGNFFGVLGVRAAIGRVFSPADETAPGANPVAVLSYGYWSQHFGSDPSILNEALDVNGTPLTVVGVAQAGFTGVQAGSAPDVYIPITMKAQMTPNWNGLDSASDYFLAIIGRLKPGMMPARAQAGLQPLYHALLASELPLMTAKKMMTSPEAQKRYLGGKIGLTPGARGRPVLQQDAKAPLIFLMAMVGLVLLIACANLACLLLARGEARQREIAVRLALGASRGRLIRQLLTESLLVAIAGGVAGLIIGRWTLGALVARIPPDIGASGLAARLDLRVLGFAAAATILSGVFFGLLPALRASRTDLQTAFKEQGASVSSGSVRLRKSLIVVQVAMTAMLLIASGLFGESLVHLERANLGMRIGHIAQFSLSPGLSRYSPAQTVALFNRLREDIAALPDVSSVSAAEIPLLADANMTDTMSFEGYTRGKNENTNAWVNYVSPHFFSTMGIPLVEGREFRDGDAASSPKVAIINEKVARKFFSGRNPIGLHVAIGGGPDSHPNIEIVGVVANAKHTDARDPGHLFVYFPYAQDTTMGDATFYVRAAANPRALAATLRTEVARDAPDLPIYDVRTLTEQLNASMFSDRLVTFFTLSLGLLAALLAAVGLYGVMAYVVARRTREIGIRMALGAMPGNVARLILWQAAQLGMIGLFIGMIAAIAAARLIRSLLYGVKAADPVVFILSALLLIVVALVACYIPARRAMRVDPIVALRYE